MIPRWRLAWPSASLAAATVVGRPIAISPLSQALLRRKEARLDMQRARGVLCHQAESGQILPVRQIQAAEHWRILEHRRISRAIVEPPYVRRQEAILRRNLKVEMQVLETRLERRQPLRLFSRAP
jgi:hypothetical protein